MILPQLIMKLALSKEEKDGRNMLTSRYERAKTYGCSAGEYTQPFYIACQQNNALDAQFVTWKRNPSFEAPCVPKDGSHDSGPQTGFFFGGFGTASFARGASGFFDRWQLQAGIPVICPMDNACFEIRWKQNGSAGHRRLRIAEDGFRPGEMEYHALFPFAYERYNAEDMPVTVILESYSPVIPHNLKDSILPITLFNLEIIPKTSDATEVSVVFCWPNVLGWKQACQSSEMRDGTLWPGHHNGGNFAKLHQISKDTVHILQGKREIGEPDDLSGEIMVSMSCQGWNPSYDVMFKETRATTGDSDRDQDFTIGKVRWEFWERGRLSNSEESWESHWHEPTASALCASATLEGEAKNLTFEVTMALPITQFGMGRRWYKLYAENPELALAQQIAAYGLSKNKDWIKELEAFHHTQLHQGGMDPKLRGAQLNELYFVTSGGAVLVSRPVDGWDEEAGRLGRRPHYGILEGFDTGYYYYNTLDLWVYGFPALSRHWPQLAEWGFADYLASGSMTEVRKNMIYRDKELKDNLIYGKLPHDLGGCAEDLFVRLNGYNFRDTPNMWKDHNPSFILAFYLHKKMIGMKITPEEYRQLKIIMKFTMNQDRNSTGIPRHDEFGDSTWDNLHMQGLSAYCGCLCIGSYGVMEILAREFGDCECEVYKTRMQAAQKSIQKLWNGSCFVTSESGKYAGATMSDGLLGLLLAKKAGLGDLVPRKQVVKHLQTAYRNNVQAFAEGNIGALLVAEPGIWNYEKDGGDEMQVNEVIVGSSWVLAACLEEFGLKEEAERLTESMFQMIRFYGLQFRTPAAWNQEGRFRAPANLRPLAVWLL